jgi:hypothetical protein
MKSILENAYVAKVVVPLCTTNLVKMSLVSNCYGASVMEMIVMEMI